MWTSIAEVAVGRYVDLLDLSHGSNPKSESRKYSSNCIVYVFVYVFVYTQTVVDVGDL